MQYFIYRSMLSATGVEKLFRPGVLEERAAIDAAEWFCEMYEATEAEEEAGAARRMDLGTYLPDDLLVKADMASMKASLELRSPLLDPNVVAASTRLTTDQRIRGRRGKAVLREMFAGRLPEGVLAGGKKGFGVPLAEWLRGPLSELVYDLVLETDFTDAAGLRNEAVAGIAAEHLYEKADHAELLWALLVLARWFDRQA
jgi:asparagine synthase (glutamine-hydrolysing)